MTDESSASDTLDAIRTGGAHLLLTVRLRIQEAEESLDRGEFATAFGQLGEAQGMLSPLAHAESNIAIAQGAYLVRARDLTPGMELVGVGSIETVEQEECDEHGEHLVVTVGGRGLSFPPGVQLYVKRDV